MYSLFDIILIVLFDRDDLIDGRPEDRCQNDEIIYCRQTLAALPAIDRLGIGKAEHDLQFPDGDACFFPHPRDILSCFL